MQYCCAVGRTLSIAKPSPAGGTPAGAARVRGTAPNTRAELALRLLALLEGMQQRAGAEDVHRLRTTVRRLEVHLPRAPKKIAQALRTLRKGAGKLRELDVHLELLRRPPFSPLRDGQARELCEPLRALLRARRGAEEEALLQKVAEERTRLERRLPAAARAEAAYGTGAVAARRITGEVRAQYARLAVEVPEDAGALHGLRIATKKLRYRLEPLARFSGAAATAAQLKKVQDAIGLWHDWATLVEIAAEEFPERRGAEAFHAVQSRADREFARARRTARAVCKAFGTTARRTRGPARGNTQSTLGRAG